jgi:holo-[acyl-carrier-protein] synthase
MGVMGVGVDIVEVKRMRRLREKYGERFLNKIFTDVEILTCLQSKRIDEMFAGRFAAKEAVMKALRAGLFEGVNFKEIEISGGVNKPPTIKLHAHAVRAAIRAGATKFSLSLTHERDFAVAVVIVES